MMNKVPFDLQIAADSQRGSHDDTGGNTGPMVYQKFSICAILCHGPWIIHLQFMEHGHKFFFIGILISLI